MDLFEVKSSVETSMTYQDFLISKQTAHGSSVYYLDKTNLRILLNVNHKKTTNIKFIQGSRIF